MWPTYEESREKWRAQANTLLAASSVTPLQLEALVVSFDSARDVVAAIGSEV